MEGHLSKKRPERLIIPLVLDETIADTLARIAEKEGTTRTRLLRIAIKQFIQNYGKNTLSQDAIQKLGELQNRYYELQARVSMLTKQVQELINQKNH